MPEDTDTSVRLPGGEKCGGGKCEKVVSKILNAKPFSKARYGIKPIKKKNVDDDPEDRPTPKPKPSKPLLSISETVAGEGTKEYYNGKDTDEARKIPTKYSGTAGNKRVK